MEGSKFGTALELGIDVKTRAAGYILMGLPLSRVRERLRGEGLPPELIPSEDTLTAWRRELNPELVRTTEDGWASYAQRAIAQCHAIMDRVELPDNDPKKLTLRPTEATIIAGIAADKITRFEDMRSRRSGSDDLARIRQLVEQRKVELAAQEASALPPPTTLPLEGEHPRNDGLAAVAGA